MDKQDMDKITRQECLFLILSIAGNGLSHPEIQGELPECTGMAKCTWSYYIYIYLVMLSNFASKIDAVWIAKYFPVAAQCK